MQHIRVMLCVVALAFVCIATMASSRTSETPTFERLAPQNGGEEGFPAVPVFLTMLQEKNDGDDAAKKDDDDDDDNGEIVILEIKVGKRPTNSPMNVAGFALKDPLTLSGKSVPSETLREAAIKGIEYILKLQDKDGAWNFHPSQIRNVDTDEHAIKKNGFATTASKSMNKVVMTSLCCMALRRHQELDASLPKELAGTMRAAIERGRQYVIDHAAKHSAPQYAPWTWSFSLMFLAEEYGLTTDEALRSKMRETARGIVDLILANQHKPPGEAPKKPANLKPTPEELAQISKNKHQASNAEKKDPARQRPSRGGVFGIGPSEDDKSMREGVLIANIDPKGPAGQGGMKAGDRVMAIGDEVIDDIDELISVIDSLEPGSLAKVKVFRPDRQAAPQDEKKKTMIVDDEGSDCQQKWRQPRGSKPRVIPTDGGWAYYPLHAVSFTTATCLLALFDAKAMGIKVPQSSFDQSVNLLESMQMRREGFEEVGYRYHNGVPAKGVVADIRGSVGRLAVCEMALLESGRHTTDDLARGLETFVKYRDELDKVKGYPGNHFVRSYRNAAYYFLYAHFFSAYALKEIPNAEQRKRLGTAMQEALVKSRNPDGTWTDHEMWGRLYGTAMAMMALGELKELAPEVYGKSADRKPPSSQPKKAE